jgi:hypothetical protein
MKKRVAFSAPGPFSAICCTNATLCPDEHARCPVLARSGGAGASQLNKASSRLDLSMMGLWAAIFFSLTIP